MSTEEKDVETQIQILLTQSGTDGFIHSRFVRVLIANSGRRGLKQLWNREVKGWQSRHNLPDDWGDTFPEEEL